MPPLNLLLLSLVLSVIVFTLIQKLVETSDSSSNNNTLTEPPAGNPADVPVPNLPEPEEPTFNYYHTHSTPADVGDVVRPYMKRYNVLKYLPNDGVYENVGLGDVAYKVPGYHINNVIITVTPEDAAYWSEEVLNGLPPALSTNEHTYYSVKVEADVPNWGVLYTYNTDSDYTDSLHATVTIRVSDFNDNGLAPDGADGENVEVIRSTGPQRIRTFYSRESHLQRRAIHLELSPPKFEVVFRLTKVPRRSLMQVVLSLGARNVEYVSDYTYHLFKDSIGTG